jgi:hypothetical protein
VPVKEPPPGPAAPPSTDTTELSGAEPKVEPKPEPPEIASAVRVLVLSESSRSFVEWLYQIWEYAPRVEWQAWYGTPSAPGLKTHSETLPPLEKMPASPDLEPVQVLVLAGFDPSRMPAEFWVRVADRVRSGSLGLLLLSENRFGQALADEPSLRTILPVTGVRAVAAVSPGSREVVGVYETERPFVVTDAGTRHPASRMVPFPGWSTRLWAAQAKGRGAWTTKFCSSATGLSAGARSLVDLDEGASRVPAVVASAGDAGRVLWVAGFFDVNHGSYTDSAGYQRMKALVISWIAWLSSPRS